MRQIENPHGGGLFLPLGTIAFLSVDNVELNFR